MADRVRARLYAVILEDQYVAHALIAFKVDKARYVRPDDICDVANFKFMQAAVVPRRLDNDFVRANPIHQVMEAFGTPSQVTLDSESRSYVRYNPHIPTWPIRGIAFPPDGEHFRRS